MYTLFIILILNLIIGLLVGLTGVSGFLLPIIYAGFWEWPIHDALTLSFIAFLVAGIIGAFIYWKNGHLDMKFAFYLGLGSLPGAFLGVQINVAIPDLVAEGLLYLFVLFAGISIILRKNPTGENKYKWTTHPSVIIGIGLFTAIICALTGAGGPILTVPILVSVGINIRTSVGVSLFNSIIIALPSAFGYFGYSTMPDMNLLILFSLAGTTIGIVIGSRLALNTPVGRLKIIIAVITILSSIYMLMTMAM